MDDDIYADIKNTILFFLLQQLIIFIIKLLIWYCLFSLLFLLTLKILEWRHNFLIYLKKRQKSPQPLNVLKSIQRQNFSLPYNYMIYIADNPNTSTLLEKLQKTCKYFFSRQQILIVDIFTCHNVYEREYYIRKKYWTPKDRPFDTRHDTKIKLIKFPKNATFWLIRELEYNNYKQNDLELILPKIYKYSLKTIDFCSVHLSEMEFEKLTFSGKLVKLDLQDVTIMQNNDHNENNKKLTWFEIYKKLPYLREFCYSSSTNEITTVDTILKLHTIEHKTKIRSFKLYLIISSPFYDLIYLWNFMKENAIQPWMEKRENALPYFEFKFKNVNGETNFSRNGKTSSSGSYRISLSSHPYIIPQYDQDEFFERNVITRLV